ncbi:20580_t:CDS:1, partial [Racocetra persica]
FVFIIDTSKKEANSSNYCKIKVLTLDDGTIVHYRTTQRATWKPYNCG